MEQKKMWGNKPYHSLNYFLRERFGEKVFKISLDAGFTCPNRDGTISKGGCLFCSERGSGDFAGDRNFSITSQFNDIKNMMQKKWKDGKYIAYFQAYTNTYATIDVLREKYEEALKQEDVVGIAIATRPDCLDEQVLDLLEEISKKVYLWVELGLQTVSDDTAKVINRGYKLDVFEQAVERLKQRSIDIVVHCIFGLPGETEGDMFKTVNYIAHSGVNGVKFHLLHLLKETPLVRLYEQDKLKFLSKEQYVDIICKSITMLPEDMVIHRLTGDAPRASLIGPMWSLKKWEILNEIDNTMNRNYYCQGLYFTTNS
ncbi:TIGR01212 family radical SAM protein [Clostridium sp. YIM B02505]|uniref:TIGR01212 family radical SAM protein n=1 Tax=Clostridium yunnanense TaxID=2800325 RepID=A0ABS1EQT6_9CLOT|nr:TIGR01212 family radical SAM protein [Clostridium yunnanense]MBK1811721.1 TIGR01212 family radical SAM protein [Clostridium yunnanense]